MLVYLTWHHVASGCKLTRNRRRFRLTLDAIPVVGPASRSAATVVEHKRRVRRVDVERAPRLGVLRPTRLGWRMRLRLHDGQVPADYEKAAEGIAHAWRVHSVRVVDVRPGYVTLWATMRDPLVDVVTEPETGELLTVRPGKLENGRDWLIDFRTVPHWLNAGATQSGKSNLANALIKGLAPQPVALVGFDLKGGVEFTPYAPRLSALATTRKESVDLLSDLVGEVENRMATCRAHGARNVWTLPEVLRPVPVVVLVDEVAELFLMADKAEKDQVSKTATALLRVAQLGRAFAVYLIVCGQRIGSDLGPGVTALRAQLGPGVPSRQRPGDREHDARRPRPGRPRCCTSHPRRDPGRVHRRRTRRRLAPRPVGLRPRKPGRAGSPHLRAPDPGLGHPHRLRPHHSRRISGPLPLLFSGSA